jgi:hypothetical protein
MNRSELAEGHLRHAKALMDAQLYSGAYYICGYVIEGVSPVRLIYRNLKQRAGTGDRPVRPGWALDSYIYKMD